MNSLFESHEKQYGNITSEITFCLSQLMSSLRGNCVMILRNTLSILDKSDESPKQIKKIENLFVDSKDLLQQMQLEINSLDTNTRAKYKNRWLSHEKELTNLETEFVRFCNLYLCI